ncbi:MAG: AMP-binding protein, partial [Hyphomonadaceae bacterium]
MSEEVVIPVPREWAARAYVDDVAYRSMHAAALADPEAFWGVHGRRLDWIKPYTRVKDTSFDKDDFHIRWYEDGVLNASANCIDRHLADRSDQTAIIWEGDEPGQSRHITYKTLSEEVCRFANVLKANGVKRGDRVTIYLPMIPEAAYAMLACARIGAVHSVVFGGFSPESLANRIKDCESKVVITADEGVRGGKIIPLKLNVDAALDHAPGVEKVIVVTRTGAGAPMQDGRDVVYEDAAANVPAACEPEAMGAEDPLFILYTSGS